MTTQPRPEFEPYAIYLKPGESLIAAHFRARRLVRQTGHSVHILF